MSTEEMIQNQGEPPGESVEESTLETSFFFFQNFSERNRLRLLDSRTPRSPFRGVLRLSPVSVLAVGVIRGDSSATFAGDLWVEGAEGSF